MAGSYKHVVTDQGNLCSSDSWYIENLGDAYEAIEEMYGMIWYLAYTSARPDVAARVEEARQNYKVGLSVAKADKEKQNFPGEPWAHPRVELSSHALEERDRNARAYGFEVGRTGELREVVETSDDNPFMDPDWRSKMKRGS